MKHGAQRRIALALLAAAAGTVTVSLLGSCGPSDPDYRKPHLLGLEEHCERVTSLLAPEGISAHCDKHRWATIDDAGVAYSFSDDGIEQIETDVASIRIVATAFHVKVTVITVMVGGGYDAPKAKYDMRSMSSPSAFYWGDDLDWVQRTIEASISTQEMKALVEQAEHYQQLVRTELDNLR